MEISSPKFLKYILVCENDRPEGDCCSVKGGRLRELLKEAVKARGLASKVRVSRTGCLDVCAEGPNVLVMPDNVWFRRVEEKDVDEILRKALEGVTK
jgi:(2Fe-2S) ferredoxin